jgi:hypothetical protein
MFRALGPEILLAIIALQLAPNQGDEVRIVPTGRPPPSAIPSGAPLAASASARTDDAVARHEIQHQIRAA